MMFETVYLGHSGFFVETKSAMMLFDYYKGDVSFIERKPADKPLFVFVSHAHADHFEPKIFALPSLHRRTEFLLSFDTAGNAAIPQDANIRLLSSDLCYDIPGLGTVQTLCSTDEGVAFLVKTPDATLFHAGDLHWWDWPGEDAGWLADQERGFRGELMKIVEEPIDAAFVVLDDRLGENFAKGLSLFLSLCRAKYVFPMHFWKDRRVIERFKALNCNLDSTAIILNTADESRWELKI